MGCKRRNTGSWGRVDDVDDEVVDLEDDVRLARRWKRKLCAYHDFKLNSGSKISSGEGNSNEGSKKILDINHIEILDDDESMDADYENFFNGRALKSIGDDHVSNHMSLDDSDTGSRALVENRSLTVVDVLKNVGHPQNGTVLESNNIEIDDKGEYWDSDYMKYLDSLPSDPFVDSDVYIDSIMDNRVNATAFNGLVENGTSGDELIENESINDEAYNNNNDNACCDMNPQHKKITENNYIKIDDHVDYKKLVDLEQFGGGGGNDQSVDNVAVDINSGSHSVEIDPCSNQSVENVTNNGGFVENRSANIDADHNDDLDDIDSEYKMFLGNLREDGKAYVLEVSLKDGISVIINYEVDDGPHSSCEVENLRKMRPSREAAGVTKHDCKPEMECDMDESYKIFLNCLKREENNVVFVHESGAKVVYGEDEDSSSDSEVIVMDTDPFGNENCTPFVISKQVVATDVDAIEDIKDYSRNHCYWFMERVTEILKKPYDQKEYTKLLVDVHSHKPIIKEKELRNGRTRVCPVQGIRKSYLDLHPDLYTKIKSAGSDKPKILNLLRGFFFWLECMPHEGVFKPWMDSSCLEVLPHGNVASDSH
ncbi:hypothetical protein GH714_022858 [Hevea brasiliensis]|uniref:Uncharacterized protein n=1 Tax=Hevea brasiliensis TaxID=3981 RepID=A0A6A6KQM5_HEVBR|nr:hypothetical protein GH714_022858 [Hevea brasiliensis]